MLDMIPNEEKMTDLLGNLSTIYGISYVLLLMKTMIWIVCGVQVAKHGNMNINIAGAVKRCVHYMQEKIVWVL